MIKEYDRVNTLIDKGKYPQGTIGVVVSFYKDSDACEVEIWNEQNYPIDVVTYKLDEIEKVSL